MTTLPTSVPLKPHSSYSFSTNARAGPGPSTLARGASNAPQMASISDTMDKEEGEISDGDDDGGLEDDVMEGIRRSRTPPRQPPISRRKSRNYSPVKEHLPGRRADSATRQSWSARPNSLPPRPPNVSTPPFGKHTPLPTTSEDTFDVKVEVKTEAVSRGEDIRETSDITKMRDSDITKMRDSPGPFLPAPASISVEEARQYMDLIRNLLQQGVSPADLVRRGATARYVTAVCEEIVAGAKRRDTLPPEQDESEPSTTQRLPTLSSATSNVSLSFPPPLARKPSLGSETSEERLVDLLMGPASPASGPNKMVASSSWHPASPTLAPPPPLDDYPHPPPPPPLRIESYRPPTPPGRPPPNAPTSLSSNSSMSSTTLTATMRDFHPLFSHAGSASPGPSAQQPRQPNPYLPQPSLAPIQNPHLQPVSTPQPNPYLMPASMQQSYAQHAPLQPNPYLPQRLPPPVPNQNPYLPAPTHIAHRSSLPPKPSLETSTHPNVLSQDQHAKNAQLTPAPIILPTTNSRVDQVDEPLPSPRLIEAELAARTALLETRRKAFESMKRRREANRPAASAPPDIPAEIAISAEVPPEPPVIDLTLDDDVSIVVDTEEDEPMSPGHQTIEEQMAQLQEEVMGLQAEQDVAEPEAMSGDVEMETESTEDGEIEEDVSKPPTPTATTPILSAPSLAPSTTSTPAVKISHGRKRANAEDMMDNRATTLPARLPPNKRRTLFGGMPQRPNRLVILLDHSDSDSDDNDADDSDKADRMSILHITSGNSTPISETAKLLAEKEESIRKLREQIEKRMKAKMTKKASGEKNKAKVAVESPAPTVQEDQRISDDVVMAESSTLPELGKVAVEENDAVDHIPTVKADIDLTLLGTLEVAPSAAAPSEPALPSAPQQTPISHYRSYTSLLPRYPQLRGVASTHSLPTPSDEVREALAAPPGDIDQTLLASVVLTRRLKKVPGVLLCASEAAGGSCADASCGDIHFVKGVLSDDDLAEYLSHFFPGKSTATILARLSEIRSASAVSGSTNRPVQSTATSRLNASGAASSSERSALSRDMVEAKELLARVVQRLVDE